MEDKVEKDVENKTKTGWLVVRMTFRTRGQPIYLVYVGRPEDFVPSYSWTVKIKPSNLDNKSRSRFYLILFLKRRIMIGISSCICCFNVLSFGPVIIFKIIIFAAIRHPCRPKIPYFKAYSSHVVLHV